MDHNLPSGPVTICQVCGSDELELVLDCGHQPLCDSLLTEDQLHAPETYYPLRQYRCLHCTLNQIDYAVDGAVVYHQHYPYRTGVTRELVAYQQQMAASLITQLRPEPNSLICDIGSNDGTLLKAFQAQGFRVTGIEPTQIAEIAIAEGVPTYQRFFNEHTAQEIIEAQGHAALVTASNVFAHMATLGDVIRGIRLLIGKDGVFVLENHYLVDVLQKAQYDTIYHEHLRTYSLRSLVILFGYYGLEVFHAERVSRYGGNIRAHVAAKGARKVQPTVEELLALERSIGLGKPDIYRRFRQMVHESRERLVTLAYEAKAQGKRFVGNSCPGRASTLLHYCGIDRTLMPYIAEQPASLKKGLYTPGKHIPVVDNQILFDEQPEYVVLLAWHYAEPIAAQLRARGLTSTLIAPLPVCTALKN
jgi:hypothetical protein